jgi:carbamoyltransferase
MLVAALAPNYHDSSVAIASEEEVLIVLEAERVTRRKKARVDRAGMLDLLDHALASIGKTVDDVTHWCGGAMANDLLPEHERGCEWTKTVTVDLPHSRVQFYAVNHHLAHAASFFASGFQNAVVDSCDAGGDGYQHATFRATKSDRSEIVQANTPSESDLTGSFYHAASSYVFGAPAQEGKLMGLAGYGTSDDGMLKWLKDNVSSLSMDPTNVSINRLRRRFGLPTSNLSHQSVLNFAYCTQAVFEEERLAQVKELVHSDDNLVLCGGAALNIHANSIIRARLPARSVFVAPFCCDTGQALGALLYFMNVELGISPEVKLPFLGMGGRNEPHELDGKTVDRVVDDLLGGRVVAWHWGRAEIGPRALGHRSLLASPLSVDSRKRVSERVKGREWFRPVAPVIPADKADAWFDRTDNSEFMLFGTLVRDRTRQLAPGVVHNDGSARLQTTQPSHVLTAILNKFEEATGVPILINTSLNGPGEPIAQTYDDTVGFARSRPDVVAYLDGVRTT